MGPVNNATGLSMRVAAGGRLNGASGLRSGSSDVSSYEPLTYAHLGASRFSHESSNDKPNAIQGRSASDAESSNPGGFRDLMEASVRALAPPVSSPSPEQAERRSPGGNGLQGRTGAGVEPSFSISMVGNQIHLAFNPKSRQG